MPFLEGNGFLFACITLRGRVEENAKAQEKLCGERRGARSRRAAIRAFPLRGGRFRPGFPGELQRDAYLRE